MKFLRQRQAKWDKRHLMTVSTHLTMEEYARLQAVCAVTRERPYRILREHLLKYIEGVERQTNPEIALFFEDVENSEEIREVTYEPKRLMTRF